MKASKKGQRESLKVPRRHKVPTHAGWLSCLVLLLYCYEYTSLCQGCLQNECNAGMYVYIREGFWTLLKQHLFLSSWQVVCKKHTFVCYLMYSKKVVLHNSSLLVIVYMIEISQNCLLFRKMKTDGVSSAVAVCGMCQAAALERLVDGQRVLQIQAKDEDYIRIRTRLYGNCFSNYLRDFGWRWCCRSCNLSNV